MAPSPLKPRVRPGPSKTKSPKRRAFAAGFDSDNDDAPARYLVSVRSAKNLKREGFRGLTNPYCQLNVGRQGPYTTDVVYDSVNPSWQHKQQTFEFREEKGPQEDKLTLACFNSGDVPELIGRLSVALSHATHKVISLPMFRKDFGGSQVWAGSVEIELHYIPEGDCGLEADSGEGDEFLVNDGGKRSSGGSNIAQPLSPCSTSLASSFIKAAKALPEKARTSGPESVASAAMVQADLLALSPRVARGAESAAAASRSPRYAGRPRDNGVGRGSSDRAVDLVEECRADAGDGKSDAGRGGERRGSWRSFFSGVVFSALLVLGGLWGLGDPLLNGQFGIGLTVLEDGGAGQQAVLLIHGSRISWLADRHLVLFVGEREVCRGGVPAPAPPMEDSSVGHDRWSSEALSATSGGGAKGRSRHGIGLEGQPHGAGDSCVQSDVHACGPWCSLVRWQGDFLRRLAAPLHAARRGAPPLAA